MEINCFGIILACAKGSSQLLKENATAPPFPHLQNLLWTSLHFLEDFVAKILFVV